MNPPPPYDRLAALLGDGGWTCDADWLAPHLEEWRGRVTGATPFLALPPTVEALQALVRLCAELRLAMTPQGGNTGLVGGQIPQGEVLVSLKRLRRVRSVDAEAGVMTLEAGLTLEEAQKLADDAGALFPLSLASQGSATIGGLVSTNAGGVHVLRYGMMRDLVAGVEAVLPDGRLFQGLSALRKDNTGYDLKQLFIGAEGTLGFVTAASLRLFPRLGPPASAMLALESPAAAVRALARLRATGALSAFELMNRNAVAFATAHVPGVRDPHPEAPWLALAELETAGDAAPLLEAALTEVLETGEARDAVIARSHAQAQDFWRLRESLPAGHRKLGAQANHDISVPVSAVPRFLEQAVAAAQRLAPGARIVAFGHLGDGNIHYSVIRPEAWSDESFAAVAGDVVTAVHDCAQSLGGSISAEHGIGVFRRGELPRYKDPISLELMRRVKAALDPLNLMNPRVLL